MEIKWEIFTSPSLSFITKALTPEAREEIEAHLAHKWGLAGNLPAAHPYKSVSPIDLNASRHNHLFTLEENGTLRTAGELNYEQANALSILVEARDEFNASVQRSFINVLNDPGSVFTVSGGGFEAPTSRLPMVTGRHPILPPGKWHPVTSMNLPLRESPRAIHL